jgi:subtilisin family serine protease
MRFILITIILLSFNAFGQINITVIDQGIDKNHPLFKDKLNSVISVIEDDSKTEDEIDGHGTHVAGIIVQESKANIKLQIIKNQSESLLTKLRATPNLDKSISKNTWSANLPQAINEAIKNKTNIINLSQITYYSTPEILEALELAKKHNILIIAASGNKEFDLGLIKKGYLRTDKSKPEVGAFPCSFQLDNVICVGNYEKVKNKREKISNYGKTIIDVWAYGMEITSACVGGKTDCKMSGSSMSTPRIVAKISELWEKESFKRKTDSHQIPYQEIKDLFLSTLSVDSDLLENSKNGKFLD